MAEGALRSYVLAALLFAADQLSKYWIMVVLGLPSLGSVPVLPVFNLTFVGNAGVSMGLLGAGTDAQRWLLVAVTGAIALVVAIWIARERNRWDSAALGLILGGALGNILDRVRFGYVIDFLHVFWRQWSFWVFNLADAAITLGVLMLLGRALAPQSKSGQDRNHA